MGLFIWKIFTRTLSVDLIFQPKFQEVLAQWKEEEEEEPLLIYTAQGSPFRRKKLSVINGSPEQQRTKTTLNISTYNVRKLCKIQFWLAILNFILFFCSS